MQRHYLRQHTEVLGFRCRYLVAIDTTNTSTHSLSCDNLPQCFARVAVAGRASAPRSEQDSL